MSRKENMREIFVDEHLKSIAITKTDGQLIAIIPNDNEKELIQSDDILIRFNYGDEYNFIEKNGKVFIEGEDNVTE